jgi:hypothetical protein
MIRILHITSIAKLYSQFNRKGIKWSILDEIVSFDVQRVPSLGMKVMIHHKTFKEEDIGMSEYFNYSHGFFSIKIDMIQLDLIVTYIILFRCTQHFILMKDAISCPTMKFIVQISHDMVIFQCVNQVIYSS